MKKGLGWKIVESWINDKMEVKRKTLEMCTKDELEGHQGELKGLRFILDKVEEATKEGNNNATE